MLSALAAGAAPAAGQGECGGLLQPPCPEVTPTPTPTPTATPTVTPQPDRERVRIRMTANRSFAVYRGGVAGCNTANGIRIAGRVTGSRELERELERGGFELTVNARRVGRSAQSMPLYVQPDGSFVFCDLEGLRGLFVVRTDPGSPFVGRSNPVRTRWVPKAFVDVDVAGRQLRARISAPIPRGAERGSAKRAHFYAGPRRGPLRRLLTKRLHRRGTSLTRGFRISLDGLPPRGSVYACFNGTVYEGSLRPYRRCGMRLVRRG